MRLSPHGFASRTASAGLAVAALLMGSAVPARAAVAGKQPRIIETLPLVISARDTPDLLGAGVRQMTVLSCEGSAMRPIPFQVDEINPDGRYVNVGGQSLLAPDEKPGLFDDNDEIALMIRDLGTRCNASQLARLRGDVHEIEVSAPYLTGPAFAYVLVSEHGLAPSTGYVRYDPRTHTISSAAQTFSYIPDRPFLFTDFRSSEFIGRENQDILDRLKVRGLAKAIGGAISVEVTENDIDAKLQSVRVGAVRIIRELYVDFKPLPAFTIPAIVTFIHYDRMMGVDVRIDMTNRARAFVSEMNVSITLDYTDLTGTRLATAINPEGYLVDGRMVEREREIQLKKEEPWYFLTGRGFHQVVVIDLEEGFPVLPTAIFIDGRDKLRPPEEVPGGMPEAGYAFLGWEGLEAKRYRFSAHVATFPGFPEGGGGGAYRSIHVKPGVSARKLGPAAAAQ